MASSMDVDQGHQPNKRLMIREMVLENFKSYAGAQHVGPFHKVRRNTLCCVVLKQHTVCPTPAGSVLLGWLGGWLVVHSPLQARMLRTRSHPMWWWLSVQCFSAVVGPNGSGKSNVIDAMLFVFGRRAKQVRGAAKPCTHCRGVGRLCSWHPVHQLLAQSLPTDVHCSRAQHSTHGMCSWR